MDEAKRKRTYVFAHAYTPEAITRCVRLGVRCIEHGNRLDGSSAAAMAKGGAFLSQTVLTHKALVEEGEAGGMPRELVAKVGALVTEGLEAVALAKRHGVVVTYGSDLLGPMRARQLEGFGVLLDAGLTPFEALATATANAAELFGLPAGAIAPGKLADLCLWGRDLLQAEVMRSLGQADVKGVWVGGKRGV